MKIVNQWQLLRENTKKRNEEDRSGFLVLVLLTALFWLGVMYVVL